MRAVQVSPKHPACPSHLRALLLGKAYRARRAPWGQSSQRALSERSGAEAIVDVGGRPHRSSAASAVGTPHRSESARRLLHLLFVLLALLAVAGAASPPFFGVGS